MTRSENKENLASFYAEYIANHSGKDLKHGQKICLSGGLNFPTKKVTSHTVNVVDSLQSNQEEADTRIVLHAVAAANSGAERIVVSCPDTDVLVLLIHHRQKAITAAEIFFQTGKEGKHTSLKRYIPVHCIREHLSQEQNNIMMSVYCLTGCDTVSSFYGHGKKSAFKLLLQQLDKFQDLACLGIGPNVPAVGIIAATGFVGALYGTKDCKSLNALRCEKARGKQPLCKLPPTEDSFLCHMKRVNGQLNIWHKATVAMSDIPDPTDAGFILDGERVLVPQMITQSPGPPELLNELVCECQPGFCNTDCICLNNSQACTAACLCSGQLPQDESDDICFNLYTYNAHYTSDSDSESDG